MPNKNATQATMNEAVNGISVEEGALCEALKANTALTQLPMLQ